MKNGIVIRKYGQYNAGNVVNVLGLKIIEAFTKMVYNDYEKNV